MPGDIIAPKGDAGKFRANIEAIKLLKAI